MSTPENKECAQACAQACAKSLVESATFQSLHKLVAKMVGIEQDPDLQSVFSIARAHGYKVTSRFWHDELKEAVEYVNATLQRAADEKKASAESNVVPFEK